MRSIILLLLVTATSCLSAQQLLFDKTIPEQNVAAASRLTNEMRSHYLDSRYLNQKDFLVQHDFLIAISPNLIGKSKFVKMHRYSSGSFWKNTEIKVYEMGKLVLKQVTVNTLTQLNISKLPAGFYLLSVNDGKGTKAAKFVNE